MSAGLEPYPAMKDSGVPWLGAVPEHWEVRPVGSMGSLFKGNGGNKGDEVPAGIPCVRYGDLYTRHEFFITKSRHAFRRSDQRRTRRSVTATCCSPLVARRRRISGDLPST